MSELQINDKVHIVGNSIGLPRDMTLHGVDGVVVGLSANNKPLVLYVYKFRRALDEFNDEDLELYG